MTTQARTSRVLIALIVSMTIGAVVLMALDNGGPQGSPWSLSVLQRLNRLNPIEPLVSGAAGSSVHTWNRVEVFYSNTTSGNLRELSILHGLQTGQDLNAHFVVCNGLGAKEGWVEPAERWQAQNPCLPDGEWRGTVGTVRICVVADGIGTMPTDIQVTRAADLVKLLSKKFKISRKQVAWPANWPQF